MLDLPCYTSTAQSLNILSPLMCLGYPDPTSLAKSPLYSLGQKEEIHKQQNLSDTLTFTQYGLGSLVIKAKS